MNNYEMALHVPRFEDEKLGMSSLILADLIEKVPTRSIGTGQFVIATSKVRPRVTETFDRKEKMGIYLQLYNFAPDERSQKPVGTIDYEVVRNGSTKDLRFLRRGEFHEAPRAAVTVEKYLPLQKLGRVSKL
jgi:hypothetical protein